MRLLSIYVVITILASSVKGYADHIHELHPTTSHGENSGWKRIRLDEGETTLTFDLPDADEYWQIVFDESYPNYMPDTFPWDFNYSKEVTDTATVQYNLTLNAELKWSTGVILSAAEGKLAFSGTRTGGTTKGTKESIGLSATINVPSMQVGRIARRVKVKEITGRSFQVWDHRVICKNSAGSVIREFLQLGERDC